MRRRLFVGLTLPDKAQSSLFESQRSWPHLPGARFARELHLTLKFLGNVADSDMQGIVAALESAAVALRPFALSIGGLGCFPNARRASVVWRGVDQGFREISEAAAQVERALEPLGFARETRPYTPHITLARLRPPLDARSWMPKAECPPAFPSFQIDQFHLIQSDLRPDGARYTSLHRFLFAA
ncbi:MAG: RNA 2',3'-cyclic phosphodiesterase [Candidatus Poribacteria bacterium]|nr:RNA 2',3'-cyclic phosphodiesterase [Candidatus Poribacteria bacterium]